MSEQDGGPAYPIPNATDLDGYVYAPKASGKSLRDWFAGQALVGILAGLSTTTPLSDIDADYIAWCCDIHADAMLRAREKVHD